MFGLPEPSSPPFSLSSLLEAKPPVPLDGQGVQHDAAAGKGTSHLWWGQLVLHFGLPCIKQTEKVFSGCPVQQALVPQGLVSPALIGGVVWGLDWRRPLQFCIQLRVNKAHPVRRSLLSSFWSFLDGLIAHEEQM